MGYNLFVMKKDDTPIIEKFEIDEKTSELKIVELTEKQLKKEEAKNTPDALEKKQRKEKLAKESQMVMKQIWGLDVEKTTNKKQRRLKILSSVFFISVVVGVLVYTFINDFLSGERLPPIGEVFSKLAGNWYYLLFAVMSVLACYLFKGLKLSVLCKYLTKKWHFKTCVETCIVGLYYNNITPLAVGGQPFEIYHLSKHGVHGGVASSLPILTFFQNQLAFVVLGATSLLLLSKNVLSIPTNMLGALPAVTSVLAVVGLCLCIFMPLLVVTFSIMPRVGAKLVKLVFFIAKKLKLLKKPEETQYKTMKTVISNSRCIKQSASNPFIFSGTFFISFLEQFANCSIAYFTLKFFGFNWGGGILEWLQVVQLCMILYAGISFIPTPGNSGAADLSFFLLFKTGLGSGYAFTAMLLWRFLSYYLHIIIGFVFTTSKKRYDKHHPVQE